MKYKRVRNTDAKVFKDFALKDRDKDRVYDIFDCNPDNPKYQDDFYRSPEMKGPSERYTEKYYEPEEIRRRLNKLHILEGSKY